MNEEVFQAFLLCPVTGIFGELVEVGQDGFCNPPVLPDDRESINHHENLAVVVSLESAYEVDLFTNKNTRWEAVPRPLDPQIRAFGRYQGIGISLEPLDPARCYDERFVW